LNEVKPSSFSLDLRKWAEVMEQYEVGGFLYHTTMPTQGISKALVHCHLIMTILGIEKFNESLKEIMAIGPHQLKDAQNQLGERVRSILQKRLRRLY
jgi:aspartate aminotransferase-like enzyme